MGLTPWEDDIEEILLTPGEIQRGVQSLGRAVSRDYADKNPLLVGILKGAVVFLADLMRYIDTPLAVDFMAVSSYGAATKTSGVVRILKDLEAPVQGRHVIIVEDIVDTGLTLRYLRDNLLARGPASLAICALLDKAEKRVVEVPLDYCAFTIPDVFVVGYGLDYAENYRHLPYIAVLREEVYNFSPASGGTGVR